MIWTEIDIITIAIVLVSDGDSCLYKYASRSSLCAVSHLVAGSNVDDHHKVGRCYEPCWPRHRQQHICIDLVAIGCIASSGHREVGQGDNDIGKVDALHHGHYCWWRNS